MMQPVRTLKNFRVLVGAPHADRKNYSLDAYLEMVKTLTYPFYDVCIVDNSDSRNNTKRIRKAGVNCIHVKPKHKSNIQYIAESHEALRVEALRKDYDFLLHLETDVFPPADIIERLLVHQKPVVGAMYPIDFGHNSHLMVQDIEKVGNVRETINLKEGADFKIIDGNLHEAFHIGLGCVLIHRDVLKQIEFRYEEGVYAHPDTFFAHDLEQLRIKRYVDTSILCEHQNAAWMPQAFADFS